MQKFKTLSEVFDADERSPMTTGELNDALWLTLIDVMPEHDQLRALPAPVRLYYTGRYLQWQVGNGGFAQAAYNAPEVFPSAADAYDAIGKHDMEQLIREAIQILPKELAELENKGLDSATIEEVFAHFNESTLSALDEKLSDIEWEVDDEWAAYARENRAAFRAAQFSG